MKLWQKTHNLNKNIEKFTVGDDYLLDHKLLKHDVIASIAHAKMLKKIGVLSGAEFSRLKKELNKILKLHRKNKFKIKISDEDCHTAIENYLTNKLRDLGKKIHTARSRNDQSIAAIRLYLKEEIEELEDQIEILIEILKQKIQKVGKISMPGYSHMQKAMPSSIGLWLEAFIESLEDDLVILDSAKNISDQSPLGSAAGYGTPIKVDRKFVMKELKFRKVQNNVLYVQNSRGKFELAALHALQHIMLDMNKLAADMMLFSTSEFGFISFPDGFLTGSSIMPQKKNPDVLELIRAKYGILLGYITQLGTILANLPSGYNRDFQLTKEPLIKGIETTKETVKIMTLVIANIEVNKESCERAMTPELYATEKVYKLVKQGVPFRQAYNKITKEFGSYHKHKYNF